MHAPRLPLLRATDLTLAFDGHRVFSGLGFALRPGLTLVRGGDGRGKTSLLRMLAGERQPDAGVIERAHGPAFLAAPRGTGEDEALTLRAWLQAQRAAHAGWQQPACADLVDAFGLAEHLDKSLFMLSTGTRRKGLLAAAFASGADLTLLDTPAAALDTRSCALLWALLEDQVLEGQEELVGKVVQVIRLVRFSIQGPQSILVPTTTQMVHIVLF